VEAAFLEEEERGREGWSENMKVGSRKGKGTMGASRAGHARVHLACNSFLPLERLLCGQFVAFCNCCNLCSRLLARPASTSTHQSFIVYPPHTLI
jgi:hypothetical protein